MPDRAMDEPVVPWPFPGDSELDKRSRIARDYRNELHRFAPEHCERMDKAARDLGQGWVAPELVRFDLNDWITVRQAADYLIVSESTIRKWIKQEPPKLDVIVGADGVQRVRVGQLMEVQRDQRERRARRHATPET